MGRKTLSKKEAKRIAKIKHAKLTKEERSAHAVIMNLARWKKEKTK